MRCLSVPLLLTAPLAIHASGSCPSISGDIATVKAAVSNSVYFCNYYLSAKHILSPFTTLSATGTEDACQCIKEANAVPTVPKTLPAATGKACTSANSDYTALEKAFKNVASFCAFYEKDSSGSRTPIGGLTQARILSACKCPAATKATTRSTTRSSTKTSTKAPANPTGTPKTTTRSTTKSTLKTSPSKSTAKSSSTPSAKLSATSTTKTSSKSSTKAATKAGSSTSQTTTPHVITSKSTSSPASTSKGSTTVASTTSTNTPLLTDAAPFVMSALFGTASGQSSSRYVTIQRTGPTYCGFSSSDDVEEAAAFIIGPSNNILVYASPLDAQCLQAQAFLSGSNILLQMHGSYSGKSTILAVQDFITLRILNGSFTGAIAWIVTNSDTSGVTLTLDMPKQGGAIRGQNAADWDLLQTPFGLYLSGTQNFVSMSSATTGQDYNLMTSVPNFASASKFLYDRANDTAAFVVEVNSDRQLTILDGQNAGLEAGGSGTLAFVSSLNSNASGNIPLLANVDLATGSLGDYYYDTASDYEQGFVYYDQHTNGPFVYSLKNGVSGWVEDEILLAFPGPSSPPATTTSWITPTSTSASAKTNTFSLAPTTTPVYNPFLIETDYLQTWLAAKNSGEGYCSFIQVTNASEALSLARSNLTSSKGHDVYTVYSNPLDSSCLQAAPIVSSDGEHMILGLHSGLNEATNFTTLFDFSPQCTVSFMTSEGVDFQMPIYDPSTSVTFELNPPNGIGYNGFATYPLPSAFVIYSENQGGYLVTSASNTSLPDVHDQMTVVRDVSDATQFMADWSSYNATLIYELETGFQMTVLHGSGLAESSWRNESDAAPPQAGSIFAFVPEDMTDIDGNQPLFAGFDPVVGNINVFWNTSYSNVQNAEGPYDLTYVYVTPNATNTTWWYGYGGQTGQYQQLTLIASYPPPASPPA